MDELPGNSLGALPVELRDAAVEDSLDAGLRRRHGQHFTKADPADLLIALCVRDPGSTVLDPACGTGILLRRAAARLRFLEGAAGKQTGRLTGIEMDPRLARAAQAQVPAAIIINGDFLDRAPRPGSSAVRVRGPLVRNQECGPEARAPRPGSSAVRVRGPLVRRSNNAGRRPAHQARAPGYGPAHLRSAINSVDAIVGNPPYVRQELIDPARKRMAPHAGPALSGRSDLHARFWFPSLALLRPGGRLGFITSGAWLDAGYGAALRDWLAAKHRLVAIVESQVESWFDRARVRTIIAIVQRDPPDAARPARFVSLRVPLASLVPAGLSPRERLSRFDRIARAIEDGEDAGDGAAGVSIRIGLTADRHEALEPAHSTRSVRPTSPGAPGSPLVVRSVPAASLGGRTWGPLLRLPDLYFEIIARGAARMVPLSEVATVRWGIKTGDDAVFCPPRDRKLLVEERFLSPLVFTLAELDRLVVTRDQLKRCVLLVDRRLAPAGGQGEERLRAWIARAEREGSHLRPTCAARARAGRAWYELRPAPPGAILWSIMHQYRHLAPLNPESFPVNDNLLQIDPKPGVSGRLLAAILNSHVTALVKHAHGRQRNEGMLKTQAGDLKAMPILDPRTIDAEAAVGLIAAFDAIASRRIGTVPQECGRADRQALDRLVLEALGWEPSEAKAEVERLSACLRGLYASERLWEVDAVRRRRR